MEKSCQNRSLWQIWSQRLIITLGIICVSLGIFMTPAQATSIYEIPPVSSDSPWIIDQAEILSRQSEGTINKSLENLAEKTGYEVRLVTFRRLDYEETIDSFTNKLFHYSFGTPDLQKNQGILALDIATNTAALYTGDELKTLLTPEITQSIVTETLPFPLREGDKYNEALLASTQRITTVLLGEPDPGPPEITNNISVEGTFKKAEETQGSNATMVVIILLLLATVIPMVTYYWYQGSSN